MFFSWMIWKHFLQQKSIPWHIFIKNVPNIFHSEYRLMLESWFREGWCQWRWTQIKAWSRFRWIRGAQVVGTMETGLRFNLIEPFKLIYTNIAFKWTVVNIFWYINILLQVINGKLQIYPKLVRSTNINIEWKEESLTEQNACLFSSFVIFFDWIKPIKHSSSKPVKTKTDFCIKNQEWEVHINFYKEKIRQQFSIRRKNIHQNRGKHNSILKKSKFIVCKVKNLLCFTKL